MRAQESEGMTAKFVACGRELVNDNNYWEMNARAGWDAKSEVENL